MNELKAFFTELIAKEAQNKHRLEELRLLQNLMEAERQRQRAIKRDKLIVLQGGKF
jgi:hypothetical protein